MPIRRRAGGGARRTRLQCSGPFASFPATERHRAPWKRIRVCPRRPLLEGIDLAPANRGRKGKRKKKGGGGYRTSSTSEEAWNTGFDSFPRNAFDFTPVITRRTRTVRSREGSTVQPQMIRAIGLIFLPTISAAFSASLTVRSGPPTTP